jgi:hypothetical protein
VDYLPSNADGSHLPPSLICQSVTSAIQSSWVEDIKANEHSVHITSSPPGWTNNYIGLAWLEQVFDRHTKEKARQSYRLVILDRHGSHVIMDFINYCDQNKILLAVFTSHSTHTLQPLDICMFKPLSENSLSQFNPSSTPKVWLLTTLSDVKILIPRKARHKLNIVVALDCDEEKTS